MEVPQRVNQIGGEASYICINVCRPARSGCVFVSHGDCALVYGGYSEVKCENMVKSKGKEHTDAWMLRPVSGLRVRALSSS